MQTKARGRVEIRTKRRLESWIKSSEEGMLETVANWNRADDSFTQLF
jgi:hypothetical protein